MKNPEKLEELLNGLSASERKKFEYVLNFYSEEHVYYNFSMIKEILKSSSLTFNLEFSSPLEPEIKEIADNIPLKTLLENFETISNKMIYGSEENQVSDFLLYLLKYTKKDNYDISNSIKMVSKYSSLMEKYGITPEEIYSIIEATYTVQIPNSSYIDLKELELKLNEALKNRIGIDEEIPELASPRPIEIYSLKHGILNDKLSTEEIDDAIRKQHGAVNKSDISIFFIKYFSGDEFEEIDHENLERIKNLLNSFNLQRLSEEDFVLLEENFSAILADNMGLEYLYFIRNIATNEEALKAFENLIPEVQEQVLKINIIATKDEISNVMKALQVCQDEKLEGKPEDFTSTKNYLSKLPPEKRAQIRELIQEELMKRYKRVIGVSEEITFGFELEATGISDKTLKEVVSKPTVKNTVAQKQGINSPMPFGWKIDYDGTVSKGVEVISPIMRDRPSDWENLKDVCKFMTSLGAKTDESCGGHIHIGANILNTDEVAWNNLFKIWSSAESIIYKMSNKPSEVPRKSIVNEASPTKPIIDDLLSDGSVSIKNYTDVKKLADSYTRRFLVGETYAGREKGLNLCPIAEGKQDTLEFRIPNGNINYLEIQRTAELYARILDVSKKMSDRPDYKSGIFIRLQNGKDEEEKMLYFLDLLFDRTIDKAIFYERYFSQPEDLSLAGKKYSDIIDVEVGENKTARYEWRGER